MRSMPFDCGVNLCVRSRVQLLLDLDSALGADVAEEKQAEPAAAPVAAADAAVTADSKQPEAKAEPVQKPFVGGLIAAIEKKQPTAAASTAAPAAASTAAPAATAVAAPAKKKLGMNWLKAKVLSQVVTQSMKVRAST